MREFWANVYPSGLGRCCESRREAQTCNGEGHPSLIPAGALYRIHVRLKPEGAPRRYVDEHERRAWENWPGTMALGREGSRGLLTLYRSGGA